MDKWTDMVVAMISPYRPQKVTFCFRFGIIMGQYVKMKHSDNVSKLVGICDLLLSILPDCTKNS